jgi:hypothetical protein
MDLLRLDTVQQTTTVENWNDGVDVFKPGV